MEGDIALASLPQSDGFIKPRPAVLLRQMPPFGDWLVCGISTQLHQRVVGLDELIVPTDRILSTAASRHHPSSVLAF
jgi:mRNA interferase MazF